MDLLSSPKLYISTTLSDSYKDKSKSTKHRYSLLNHCNRGEVMIKFTKSKLGKFLFLLSFYKTLTESIYTTDILYGFHVSVYIYICYLYNLCNGVSDLDCVHSIIPDTELDQGCTISHV